jgi:hypothetical protein
MTNKLCDKIIFITVSSLFSTIVYCHIRNECLIHGWYRFSYAIWMSTTYILLYSHMQNKF